jgi:hypothetical protein
MERRSLIGITNHCPKSGQSPVRLGHWMKFLYDNTTLTQTAFPVGHITTHDSERRSSSSLADVELFEVLDDVARLRRWMVSACGSWLGDCSVMSAVELLLVPGRESEEGICNWWVCCSQLGAVAVSHRL